MQDYPIEKLAEEIAEDLFINGIGKRAHRLVLTDKEGCQHGGWSEAALANRIVRKLQEMRNAGLFD